MNLKFWTWFKREEITGGINNLPKIEDNILRDEKGRFTSKHKKYPNCCGSCLPSENKLRKHSLERKVKK